MKKLLSSLLISILLFSSVISPVLVNAQEPVGEKKECVKESAANLIFKQRKLWLEHVLWTRNFIISDLNGLENKDVVLERLLKNQEDIGNSLKPYYGNEAGDKVTELLKEHITLAGKVVAAAKSSNKEELEKSSKLWYENADKITDYLNKLNPQWSKPVLKDLLYKHLQLLTEQTAAMISKDWAKDIASYDRGEDHIIKLADTISEGIIKQFPKKFQ